MAAGWKGTSPTSLVDSHLGHGLPLPGWRMGGIKVVESGSFTAENKTTPSSQDKALPAHGPSLKQ